MMTIRWLLTLACVSLFCCALILIVYTREDISLRQEYVTNLEKQKQELINLRNQHIKLARQLEDWNSFWKLVEDSDLDPENWHEYPVRVQGRYYPQQTQHIMQLLSNDISAGRDYWFVPQYVYASPFLEETEDEEQRTALQLQIRGKIMVNYHDF